MSRVGSSSPRKRQRTEASLDSVASLADATHHERHWYDDGSIVLHVEDVVFRVHYSSMLSLPRPVEAEELDGCPVVHLQSDHSRDWTELLDAVYDTLTYFETLSRADLDQKFPAVTGLLRVSTKYCVVPLRLKCLSILSGHFIASPTYASVGPLPSYAQACEIVKLARETNSPTLLPFALLTIASEPDYSLIYSTDLPPESMFSFLKTYKCPKPWNGYCTSTPEAYFQKYLADPERLIFSERGLCEACKAAVKASLKSGRQKIWERLPGIFHLGADWSELQRVQECGSTR
ncbi:hypothetical protein BD626DRAFT_499639, partial [Schizophyllum amplum]